MRFLVVFIRCLEISSLSPIIALYMLMNWRNVYLNNVVIIFYEGQIHLLLLMKTDNECDV